MFNRVINLAFILTPPSHASFSISSLLSLLMIASALTSGQHSPQASACTQLIGGCWPESRSGHIWKRWPGIGRKCQGLRNLNKGNQTKESPSDLQEHSLSKCRTTTDVRSELNIIRYGKISDGESMYQH
jgi:hypothetical protein